ncbi:aspartate--tRNA ligase [Streptomyces olivoverticillatus]
MHRNIMLRSAVISALRQKMTALGFNELATPILSATSPEGARDFLVPSRLHAGKFYALPQAPQQFKQLLMIAGFDRYFQIAPCFRDEDARADRSPGEFYQLDMEMSFVEQEDVFQVIEKVMTDLFEEFGNGRHVTSPFPRIPFREAMLKYGSDKPDLRAQLELVDVSGVFADSGFKAFAGKHVRALAVPDTAQPSPASSSTAWASTRSSRAPRAWPGCAWPRAANCPARSRSSSPTRTSRPSPRPWAWSPATPSSSARASSTRSPRSWARSASRPPSALSHFEENVFRFCWIVDFPMFEKDEETGKIEFSHNPFSMPQGGLEALNTMDPLDILAWQYDIVCNGTELSSGAIRNHEPEVMYRAFEIAGYSKEEVEKEFGGMLRAFKFGAPPHGGIAPGVDRIVMLLADEPNIRETIAFPLNGNAQDLLMGAPSEVDDARLKELHLSIYKGPAKPTPYKPTK